MNLSSLSSRQQNSGNSKNVRKAFTGRVRATERERERERAITYDLFKVDTGLSSQSVIV